MKRKKLNNWEFKGFEASVIEVLKDENFGPILVDELVHSDDKIIWDLVDADNLGNDTRVVFFIDEKTNGLIVDMYAWDDCHIRAKLHLAIMKATIVMINDDHMQEHFLDIFTNFELID
jgi:hypothetical protein